MDRRIMTVSDMYLYSFVCWLACYKKSINQWSRKKKEKKEEKSIMYLIYNVLSKDTLWLVWSVIFLDVELLNNLKKNVFL